MTVSDQLLPASFRGFPFLLVDESANSGRKVVVHEYPNADKRNVEDLGLSPRVFKLSAIIHGDINKRFDFEKILRKPGTGELVHPVYGSVTVKSGAYTVASNQESIGEFNFKLTFYITSDIAAPEERELDTSKVTVLAKKVGDDAGDVFVGEYKTPSTAKSLTSASDRLNNVFDTIQQKITKVINPVTDAVADFNKKREEFRRNIVTIAQNANRIRETIDSVRLSIANFANTPADLLAFWNDLTDFGTDPDPRTGDPVPTSPELPQNTDERLEISNNLSLIDEYVRTFSVAGSVEAVSYKASEEDITDVEILEATSRIDNRINITLNQQVDDRITDFIAQDQTVRETVYQLVSTYKNVVSANEANIWKTRQEETELTSLALMTHRFYGSIDNIGILEKLNNLKNTSAIRDEATLVS